MSVPHSFSAVTSATGQQLDDNFAACLQLNAANTLSNQLNYAPSVSIASAATVNIGAAASNNITISGTTTITAFDTIAEGAIRIVTYSGAVPITYNATSMQLIGAISRTNNVGDVSVFRSLGTGNWKELFYQSSNMGALNASRFFHLQEQQASGTNSSATPLVTTWITRVLNTTLTNTINGASVALNAVTLPSGTYAVEAQGCAYLTQGHQLRLYNQTDATVVTHGLSSYSNSTGLQDVAEMPIYIFTIAASKTFLLQHYTTASGGTLGSAQSTGAGEVYADLKIWRIGA